MQVPFFSFDLQKFELIEKMEHISYRDPSWSRSPIKAIRWARKVVDADHRNTMATLSRIESSVRVQYLGIEGRLSLPGMFKTDEMSPCLNN